MLKKFTKILTSTLFIIIFATQTSIFTMQNSPSFFNSFLNKMTSLFNCFKKKSPKIIILESAQQNDGWRCGLFAALNAYWLHLATTKKTEGELPEILTNIKLQNRQNQFENFFNNLENSELKKLIQEKTWLSPNQIETLLNLLLKQPLYTQSINISIVDASTWNFDSLPQEKYIFQNLKKLREKNIPQIIILVLNKHWTTHIFTKNTIWTTNSIKEYDKVNLINFLKKLHNYFTLQDLNPVYSGHKSHLSSSTQVVDLTKEPEIIDLT
jgi:hypothetical protein